MDTQRITLDLSKGQQAIIDAADFEREAYCEFRGGFVWTGRICDGKWSANQNGQTFYAYRTIKQGDHESQLYLHRVVMDAGQFQLIDHRDGNGLNCWKDNLRVSTSQDNSRNRRPRGNRKFKGVYFHKMSGKYQAAIGISGKSKHLGLFATQEEAAIVYDTAAKEHFGEFARLNFPVEARQ